jgi:hypothetical protein
MKEMIRKLKARKEPSAVQPGAADGDYLPGDEIGGIGS